MFDRALVMAEEAEPRQRGWVMCDFGGLCSDLGQVDKSIWLVEQALSIAEELGDKELQGNAQWNLAKFYTAMGQYWKAVTLCQKARHSYEALADLGMLMRLCGEIGECLAYLGEYEEGIKSHKECWARSKQLGDTSYPAHSALNIGVTLWKQVLAGRLAESDSADGVVQMQKKSDEVHQWLATALDQNVVNRLYVTMDTNLNLSYVVFFMSQEAEALKHLQVYLECCAQHTRDM